MRTRRRSLRFLPSVSSETHMISSFSSLPAARRTICNFGLPLKGARITSGYWTPALPQRSFRVVLLRQLISRPDRPLTVHIATSRTSKRRRSPIKIALKLVHAAQHPGMRFVKSGPSSNSCVAVHAYFRTSALKPWSFAFLVRWRNLHKSRSGLSRRSRPI
jgi:hypothetical protein